MEEFERQRDAHELAIYNSNPERFNESDLRNTRSRSSIARIRGGGVAVRRATSITRLNRHRVHRNRIMTNADRIIDTSHVPSSIFNGGMTFAFDLNFGPRVHGPSIESNTSNDSVDFIVLGQDRNSSRSRTQIRDNVMHIVGMFLNSNTYSSDSEDSFMAPRIIDPNDISEDESDEEVSNIVELPAPEELPSTEENSGVHRAVTRSMSRNPEFYSQPGSSRRTIPYPSTSKNAAPFGGSKTKAETTMPGTKTVIKVDKMNPCTICCEEAPKRPVACTYCRQTIGCRYCVKKWFFTTNVSHLDQRTPYPMGSTDRNHKRCPLCRADWGDTMRIVTAVERDAFPALIQVSNPPTSSNTEDPTKS